MSNHYLISVGLLVVGIVLLVWVLLRVVRAARRTKTLLDAVSAVVANETGLLRARRAALRVAIDQRRRKRLPSA